MRHLLLTFVASASLLALPASLDAQQPAKRTAKAPKPNSTPWDAMDVGPFFSSGLHVPGVPADRARPALKDVSIKVGPDQEATMCFDTERCRMAIGWTGGFLKLRVGREGLEGGPHRCRERFGVGAEHSQNGTDHDRRRPAPGNNHTARQVRDVHHRRLERPSGGVGGA